MFIKDHLSQSNQLSLMFRAVESARNGVVMTDPNQPDNPIIYTNPAFTEITGYSAEEILGHNCRFLQQNDHDQSALVELRQAIKQERSVVVVLRNYRKDGTRFFNELTVSPVRNELGKLVSFVGIQNDITARVEAEERISDFYSVVSHELRTPIAKIKSSLSVIADGEAGPINDAVRRFVEISAKSADSLWKLIENILDSKKLESGKFRLIKRRLLLGELVENVIAEFSPVAQEASIKLMCQIKPDIYVNADEQRLSQVLENLLSNAVKFSPFGSEVSVNVIASNEKRVRVQVSDDGPGIASRDYSKLFEKFQQLDAPDRRMRGGTGLGLSICKAIIEAHAGQIGVLSGDLLLRERGKEGGSIFWFELDRIS